MLYIHHSNRLEVLFDRLRAVIAAPLSDPFLPEEILVQNQGMARWLSQRLAQTNGIAANLAFPLPASFVWRLFRAWMPDIPEQSAYEKETLGWRIFARLPEHLAEPAFAELSRYLSGEPRMLKRWQLSLRIADVFDQYLVYRPELVLGWEAGEGTDWQALLWRDLVAQTETDAPGRGAAPHRARLLARLQAAFDAGRAPADPALLPERIALFGLSALPPAYCKVLEVVAAHREVHLFLLNPCTEYWADIVDEKGRERRRARAAAAGQPDPGALLDLGNPLLAAFGHTGQAFLDQVLELEGDAHDCFIDPGTDRLLARLQHDVLTLTDPRRSDPGERLTLDPLDDSLLIHCCHGPLREVQVLHDRLLALFERTASLATRSLADPHDVTDAPLEPRDILVMAPDIERYAPFVDAVFGAAPAARRIPWSIADRRLGSEQPLLAAFAELLALPLSRVTATDVLGWLEVPAIARRFGIDEQGLARIRTWIDEAGIRWGLDATMRTGLGLPEDNANTWAFGLQRLFLGYALPDDGLLYGDTLPYVDVEGGEGARLLGGLQSFIDALAQWHNELACPHTAEDWNRRLGAMLDVLFAPDDEEEGLLERLREALDGLTEHARAAGLDEALEPDLIRARLQQVLEESGGASRFLSGRVTFCNMVPMRSIPARVVCLLGMNGVDFPRGQRPLGFDLIARHPRRGDRSRRHDDRYLFLEALLSAREYLHISYVGRDPRDNAVKVPSVVVEELLDCIDRSFKVPADPAADDPQQGLPSRHLVIEHPLQPFSPRYFDAQEPRLFSFADDWLAMARATVAADPPPFAGPGLDDEPPDVVELDELIRCLGQPARWFLEQRLRLRLPARDGVLAETEPFAPNGLERWSIDQRLLALSQAGPIDAGLAVLRAEGVLPHGEAGRILFTKRAERVARFRARLEGLSSAAVAPVEVDLTCGGARLQGWLDGLTEDGLLCHRLGRLRGKDLLALWLRHLVLNAIAPAGIARCSVCLSDEKDNLKLTRLRPLTDASERLAELLDLWRRARREPLPLFPDCSLVWARTGSMDAVDKVWRDSYNGPPGEGSDLAVQTAFRGVAEPLGADFCALAVQVFGPLLAVLEEDDK